VKLINQALCPVIVVLAVAALLRCAYAMREPLDERDADVYRGIARHIVAGDGFTEYGTSPETRRPPLIPLILAGIYRLGGTDQAARQVWAGMGVLLVWVVYQLVRTRHNEQAARLAMIGIAFYPYNILMGGSTSTEIPNILLFVWLLWAVSQWQRFGRVRHAGWAGIAAGLLVLNRPIMLFLALIALGAMFVSPGAIAAGRKWKTGAISLGISALLVFPWCIRNTMITGNVAFITTAESRVTWEGNNPWLIDFHEGRICKAEFDERLQAVAAGCASATACDTRYREAMYRFWREQPGLAMKTILYKTVQFWQMPGATTLKTTPEAQRYRLEVLMLGWLFWVPLLVLCTAAIVLLVYRGRFHQVRLYSALILMAYVTHIWGASVTRYRYASGVDALMMIITALGFACLFNGEQLGWTSLAARKIQ
jgi:hypothetical protein